MNRTEFLSRLEELLSDVQQEEREEALSYYTDYFEDAGEENEADVIKQLGSPEKVAEIIKADLAQNGAGGEFTEKGFHQTDPSSSQYEVLKPNEVSSHNPDEYVDVEFREAKDEEQGNERKETKDRLNGGGFSNGQNAAAGNANTGYKDRTEDAGRRQRMEEDLGYRIGPDGRKYYENTGRNQNGYRSKEERRQEQQVTYRKRSAGEVILLILFILFIGIPVGIPCLAVVFSLFVAAGATVFSLVIGFGAAGIGCLVAGFAVAAVGIGKLFVLPGTGALFIGGGLICLGIGLLFILLTGLCAKAIPAICRGFISVCRAPFRHRSVMA